ncbi:uncharacterized protein [Choristoneura fumiferana]|uniref:uncharacterized protein n=1 Tax=Choristoneura fumiferana TaxID=7141 RepID=UPI003D155863
MVEESKQAVFESNQENNVTCGKDLSPVSAVYEGVGQIETYPWLGVLFYPIGRTRVTTVVVLVTRQILISSASEIDKVPKNRFRARSRVVLGRDCSAGPKLRIRDYTYHPEFEAQTYSALALIQLELDDVYFDLHPICGPPLHFVNMRIYALSLNEDCDNPVVKIHEMEYVDNQQCRQFYRRSGLDVSSLWPTHVTCARAMQGGECVWRGGAALAAKIGNRWHLLGFGVYGPGCRAPARFMDYGIYTQWVKNSIARIGKPAVTRMSASHIILRRTTSNLQRYGPCDKEEIKTEMYSDEVEYREKRPKLRSIKYNVTIFHSVEYNCVTFQVIDQNIKPNALIRLRHWCVKPRAMCYGFNILQIDFYVEIKFSGSITFHMHAYGQIARAIDVRAAMKYGNAMRPLPLIPDDDQGIWYTA